MARRKNLDFAGMVAKGENPNGFVAQTANGTASDSGEGHNQERYNHGQQADGVRWNGGFDRSKVKGALAPASPYPGEPKPWGPNTNRTGE